MENAHASAMIHMFLSGSAPGGIGDGMEPDPLVELPQRRLLLACSGNDLVLSGTARNMAFGLGRNNSRTSILKIPDGNGQGEPGNLAGYDGIFIGISPDGSGASDRAFSFIRNYFKTLSAKPLALFFILPRLPEAEGPDTRLAELSPLCPLDVRCFDRSSPDIQAGAARWAVNTVWPLMETGWLADIIFPEPVPETDCPREQPRAAASLC